MEKYLDSLIDSTNGTPIAGASVQVNVSGGGAATIFSDNGVTTTANPLTSEADGSFYFFAANGVYDLVITKPGFTFDPDDTAKLTLFDFRDAPAMQLAPVSGAANAIILSPVPAVLAYAGGQMFAFLATASNTGATTIALSALAAKSVVKSGGAALVAGDITSGDLVVVMYDGTKFFMWTPPDPFNSVGANGTIPMARSAAAQGVAYVAALNKAIYGFTYQNNVADAVNDLDIAAGGAMDATGAYFLVGGALTKQSDVAWAVGNAAGMLDTGAVGNSDYYLFVIGRSDTGVVDYLSSLSATSPTMPTNYDFKRLIGWFKRVGGTIVAFDTYELPGGGLELIWDSPTLDIDLSATLTTSRRTDAIKVPLTFSVKASMHVALMDAAAGNSIIIYCPDQADLVPSASAAPLTTWITQVAALFGAMQIRVRTSAAGTIAARANVATVDTYRVATLGFEWSRR